MHHLVVILPSTEVHKCDRVQCETLTIICEAINIKHAECLMKSAGHVESMADDGLPKRAAELHEEGRSRRGRPRLRWEDCVKRDVKKTGEEGDWKKTRDRGGWKRKADEAVKKLQAAPHL